MGSEMCIRDRNTAVAAPLFLCGGAPPVPPERLAITRGPGFHRGPFGGRSPSPGLVLPSAARATSCGQCRTTPVVPTGAPENETTAACRTSGEQRLCRRPPSAVRPKIRRAPQRPCIRRCRRGRLHPPAVPTASEHAVLSPGGEVATATEALTLADCPVTHSALVNAAAACPSARSASSTRRWSILRR